MSQRPSGVQVFAKTLCKELYEAGVNFSFIVPSHLQIKLPDYDVEIIRYGKLSGHFWEQLELPKFVKKQNVFLLNLCNSGPIHLRQQSTVIHDLAFFKNPSWFSFSFSAWYRFMIPKMARSCKHLFTVSESVKSEISETLKIEKSCVTVIGNKVDVELLDSTATRPLQNRIEERSYYLMVGTNDPRKNFKFATDVLTEEFGESVIIVGGDNRNFNSASHIESDRVVRIGHVAPGELKWLYEHAKALIAPSLYEGFGIPNLEAMAMGCPLICSDIPVYREICGAAAVYFDPNDKVSFSNAIKMAFTDQKELHTRLESGKVVFGSYQSAIRSKTISKSVPT
jgi:glycosyltransferase involved in cell wall biosynthesis